MDQVTITLNLHSAEMYHNKGNLNSSQVICNLISYMESYLNKQINIMAFQVMEFQDQGYKTRKIFA